MPISSYANQRDIDAMTQAVDTYCRECAVTDEVDRSLVAKRIALLYFSGHESFEEILGALRTSDREGKPSPRPDFDGVTYRNPRIQPDGDGCGRTDADI